MALGATPEHDTLEMSYDEAPLKLIPEWMESESALDLYKTLAHEVNWQQPLITVYGKQHRIPRLQSWQGNDSQAMRYSQKRFIAEPFHPRLLPVLYSLNQILQATDPSAKAFNTVLLNYYRNGDDGMGWHSDDEPELGQNPVIASISLGAARAFDFRLRHDHTVKKRFILESGSLLLMLRDTQGHWQHALPKSKRMKEGRINLTFRYVKPSA